MGRGIDPIPSGRLLVLHTFTTLKFDSKARLFPNCEDGSPVLLSCTSLYTNEHALTDGAHGCGTGEEESSSPTRITVQYRPSLAKDSDARNVILEPARGHVLN
jgi:hypothetical protein